MLVSKRVIMQPATLQVYGNLGLSAEFEIQVPLVHYERHSCSGYEYPDLIKYKGNLYVRDVEASTGNVFIRTPCTVVHEQDDFYDCH